MENQIVSTFFWILNFSKSIIVFGNISLFQALTSFFVINGVYHAFRFFAFMRDS